MPTPGCSPLLIEATLAGMPRDADAAGASVGFKLRDVRRQAGFSNHSVLEVGK